jgi:hypothetical protein
MIQMYRERIAATLTYPTVILPLSAAAALPQAVEVYCNQRSRGDNVHGLYVVPNTQRIRCLSLDENDALLFSIADKAVIA